MDLSQQRAAQVYFSKEKRGLSILASNRRRQQQQQQQNSRQQNERKLVLEVQSSAVFAPRRGKRQIRLQTINTCNVAMTDLE